MERGGREGGGGGGVGAAAGAAADGAAVAIIIIIIITIIIGGAQAQRRPRANAVAAGGQGLAALAGVGRIRGRGGVAAGGIVGAALRVAAYGDTLCLCLPRRPHRHRPLTAPPPEGPALPRHVLSPPARMSPAPCLVSWLQSEAWTRHAVRWWGGWFRGEGGGRSGWAAAGIRYPVGLSTWHCAVGPRCAPRSCRATVRAPRTPQSSGHARTCESMAVPYHAPAKHLVLSCV
jgi:hypothetical protein